MVAKVGQPEQNDLCDHHVYFRGSYCRDQIRCQYSSTRKILCCSNTCMFEVLYLINKAPSLFSTGVGWGRISLDYGSQGSTFGFGWQFSSPWCYIPPSPNCTLGGSSQGRHGILLKRGLSLGRVIGYGPPYCTWCLYVIIIVILIWSVDTLSYTLC